MRVPQVSERIKEAPAQALRGVFAGIGQLLLISDKLRNKAPAGAGVPRARKPGPAEAVAAPPEPAPVPAPVPVPVPAEDVATETVVAETLAAETVVEAVVAEPGPAEPVPVKAAPAKAAQAARKPPQKPPARDFDKTGNVRLLEDAEDADAAEASSPAVAAGTAALPLPNYDELTIASLRARLRNLDVSQLKQVADYERAHKARAEVIAMFERRVAKLEAEPEAGA